VIAEDLRRLGSLARRDRVLILQAAILLPIVLVALRMCSYERVRAALDRMALVRAPRDQSRVPAPRVGWAVKAAAARMGRWSSCLVEAVATAALLRRHGHASTVRFGVDPRAPRLTLKAHAWIECEGSVIVGELPEQSEYRVLAAAEPS
jgi:hypothetical protein